MTKRSATMALYLAFIVGLSCAGLAKAQLRDGRPITATATQDARGWHFYEDPEPPPLPPKMQAPAHTASVPAPLPRAPELVQFEFMQKRMEELRNIAIVSPSFDNVERYMAFEKMVVDKASLFADVAQRVAWQVPGLDPTTQGRPVNAAALKVYDRQVASDRSGSVAQLGKDHVLLFFFRSDCPYCHAMAPTLKAFERQHGIKVEAVSLDGPGLPEFPQPRPNGGIAASLKVTQVPALFLAQPFSGVISPVGVGVMTQPELLERISSIAAAKDTATVQISPIVPPN